MSAMELQFRTCAFGGFQKQDVLNYIESSNREHDEQADGLKRELDEALRAKAALEEAAAAAREREASLVAENARLTGERDAALREAEERRAALEEEKAARGRTGAELERVKARLDQAEPAAQAYGKIKDRTAGIELEAHCRAQEVQARAEEHVRKLRAQAEQWLCRVQEEYDRLRTDVDATLSHADGELEQVRRTLADLSGVLARQDEALAGLAGVCRGELHQAPQPLPLDEH